MPSRVPLAVTVLFVAVAPATAQTIHRNGFAGRTTAFVRGDSTVPFQEVDHRIADEFSKTGGTSEYIKIEANPQPGATEAEYVHYFYETPPAPVTDRLLARVFVRSFRGGVQVKGRIVLPKERDPKNPDAPLTVLVAGDIYSRPRQWDGLGLGNVEDALNRQLSVLGAKLGRAVNKADAYLDRIVLNVYAGPGTTEVWIDDLEVGPVKADAQSAGPRGANPPPAIPAGKGGARLGPQGRAVEYRDGQIVVEHDDGELRPFFMRAVRYTDTPPEFFKDLRDAGFNTIWFSQTANPAAVEEAIRQGFFIVPELPLPTAEWADGKPKRPDAKQIEADADRVGQFLRQYLAADAVLMWDLGTGRTAEDLDRVARVAGVIRRYDPRRPRAVDLWDGFSAYGSYSTAIGSHRFPLNSSLSLDQYRDWLDQRRALVGPGKMTFTWVQDHFPEWLSNQLCGPGVAPTFPTGPHPEQIRILTYLGLAAGCRGLGFWSDRALYAPDPNGTDCLHGRERLLEAALLNAEIEMLAPVLFQAQDPARWKETSHPHVQAAILRGAKDIVVLPVWLGPGTQHCPPLAALPELRITVPMVPEGAVPYLITPAEVKEIKGTKRTYGGVEITIEQFDTACAVVFTSDRRSDGILVRWQDHARRKAREAARLAQMLAVAQFNKTCQVHEAILKAGGPVVPEANELLHKARQALYEAKVYADNNQFEVAYRECRRALQPLRTLMRADWENAVRTLDYPAASPYAVSFYTLPQLGEGARLGAGARPAGSGLAHGGFELSRPAPEGGAAVTSLPGWKVRKLILDKVEGVAAIVNVDANTPDKPPDPPVFLPTRYAPLRVAPRTPDFRQPEFGSHCLRLAISEKGAAKTQVLERAVLAVDSPLAEFPPGQLVRVSFWAKVPTVAGSADGFVAFDTAGGEPLGVRIRGTPWDAVRKVHLWQQFHLYRRAPADGRVGVSFVLTGLGEAFVDDVRIEPIIGGVASNP